MSSTTVSDKMEHQMRLEELFSKNQLIPRIKAEIVACPELMDIIRESNLNEKFAVDLLVQMALHKRADLKTLVGLLRHHFDNPQTVVDEIIKCAEADLVNYSPELEIFIVVATVSQDVQEDLDRFQFPLPIVCEPKKITNNRQAAYLLNDRSVILRNNHHENDVCLDHLNRMNAVRLKIDFDTSKMIENKWRNLDKRKEGETQRDFEARRRAFEKYDRTAHDVIGLLVEHGNDFSLDHRYDKRGRTYAQGYHVQYQGTAWNKAIIQFVNEEVTV